MKTKRIIAIILGLLVMLDSFVIINRNNDNSIIVIKAANTETSGMCGENIAWEYDGNGVLTIRGNGNMEEWDSSVSVPWYDFRGDIKSVVIEEGIASISNNSFYSCYNLIDVALPESLNLINSWAFENCTSLEEVFIPKNVLKIGDFAFEGCRDLKKVSFLGDTKEIGESAFYECESLETISLPSSLRRIEYNSFGDCTSLKTIEFGDNLVYIGKYAFSGCKSLDKLVLPDSLEVIADYAFYGCEQLTEIKLPKNLTILSHMAFTSICNYNVSEDNMLYSSEEGVIYNKSKDALVLYPIGRTEKSFSVPEGTKRIDSQAFYHSSLVEVHLPDHLESIGYCAFEDCFDLEKINIPDSVTDVGESVFYCGVFKSKCYDWEDGVAYIDSVAFDADSNITNCSIRNGTRIIAPAAFMFCKNMSSIEIPDTVFSIGGGAFYECSSLSEIEFPSSVTDFGEGILSGCFLDSVTINAPQSNIVGIMKGCDYDKIYFVRSELNYDIQIKDSLDIAAEESKNDNLPIEYSSYTNKTTYNNGFGNSFGYTNFDNIKPIRNENGDYYSFYDAGDEVLIIPEDPNFSTITIKKEGWRYGSGIMAPNDFIYIIWGIPVNENALSRNDLSEVINVVISKYDKNGNFISENGMPIQYSQTLIPFNSGNAVIEYNDGIVFSLYNTLWLKSKFGDGRNHQGMNMLAVDAETMDIASSSNWQGSHSFGSQLIKTEHGFIAIQMGDANDIARGININIYSMTYDYSDELEGYLDYTSIGINKNEQNGKHVIYQSSGQYGTNDNHLDGNYTYTHMGGIAESKTTYAIAGKSEKLYIHGIHKNSSLATETYDVFVRIIDKTFNDATATDCNGITREGGTDKNIIWLTECNEHEKAGAVNIVALGDGAYCVLWEKFIDDKFDSIRYTILDEKGYTLRPESRIIGARLSDISTQPLVEDYNLKWVVADAEQNAIKWYSLDLNTTTTLPVSSTTTHTTTTASMTSGTATSTTVSTSQTTAASSTGEQSSTTTETQLAFNLGDVNDDGKVDAKDASMILVEYSKASTGAESGFTESQKLVGEVNGDGKIDAKDASAVLAYYALVSTAMGDVPTMKEFITQKAT